VIFKTKKKGNFLAKRKYKSVLRKQGSNFLMQRNRNRTKVAPDAKHLFLIFLAHGE
jgi:hypothetical protein